MRILVCIFALALIGPACDFSGKDRKCQKVVQRGGKKLVKMVACAPSAQAKTTRTGQP